MARVRLDKDVIIGGPYIYTDYKVTVSCLIIINILYCVENVLSTADCTCISGFWGLHGTHALCQWILRVGLVQNGTISQKHHNLNICDFFGNMPSIYTINVNLRYGVTVLGLWLQPMLQVPAGTDRDDCPQGAFQITVRRSQCWYNAFSSVAYIHNTEISCLSKYSIHKRNLAFWHLYMYKIPKFLERPTVKVPIGSIIDELQLARCSCSINTYEFVGNCW